jgi:serine/threonine protein kinase
VEAGGGQAFTFRAAGSGLLLQIDLSPLERADRLRVHHALQRTPMDWLAYEQEQATDLEILEAESLHVELAASVEVAWRQAFLLCLLMDLAPGDLALTLTLEAAETPEPGGGGDQPVALPEDADDMGFSAALLLFGPSRSQALDWLTSEQTEALAGVANEVLERSVTGRRLLEEIGLHLGAAEMTRFVSSLRSWVEANRTGTSVEGEATTRQSQEELTEVGGFEILDILGQGGMGRVYKARQRSLDRLVAVKILAPALQQDLDFVQRLEEEAMAAARLQHPNIVGVIEQGTCPLSGVKFVAFEYVEGPTALDLVAELGRLPEPDALTICLGVADALSCAEDHGIVHRDIKPENILIGPDGIPKLADLGLAKRIGEPADEEQHSIQGTPNYMAPEQALSLDVDIRSDLYALGVTLFHMVSGDVPFKGSSAIEIASQHITEQVPDVRTVEAGVSEWTAQLIAWLCAREPDQRFATAAAATKSLRRVLDGKPPFKPGGSGVPIGGKKRTSTGVRARPASLQDHASEEPLEVEHQEDQPRTDAPESDTTPRRATGRGFYDDLAVDETDPQTPRSEQRRIDVPKLRLTKGVGYYDEMLLGSGDLEPQQPSTPEPVVSSPLVKKGSGRGFYDDTILSQHLDTSQVPSSQAEAGEEEAPEMILSDDMSRAYQIKRLIREGRDHLYYEVEVQGDQEFEGFGHPVSSAVMKVSRSPDAGRAELSICSTPDRRLPRVLDAGDLSEVGWHYMILEPLQPHPFQRFTGGVPVDPATATDTFLNLLESLKKLHFRRSGPLVLCDIKPQKIMLRMPSEHPLDVGEYLERLSRGAYEPVLVSPGRACSKDALTRDEGRVGELSLGSPLFLPPESAPRYVDSKDGRGRIGAGTFSVQTDIYSLCMTYYVHLTCDRPYASRGVYDLLGEDFLVALLRLKSKGVSPIDVDLLEECVGRGASEVRTILEAGLEPDPNRRLSAGALLRECKKRLHVTERETGRLEDYRYDDSENRIRLSQGLFPRLIPSSNDYLNR